MNTPGTVQLIPSVALHTLLSTTYTLQMLVSPPATAPSCPTLPSPSPITLPVKGVEVLTADIDFQVPVTTCNAVQAWDPPLGQSSPIRPRREEAGHRVYPCDVSVTCKVMCCTLFKKLYNHILEGTARYAGLLLAPAEGFGVRPRLFLPFGQKKSLLCCFGPFLAIFGVQ